MGSERFDEGRRAFSALRLAGWLFGLCATLGVAGPALGDESLGNVEFRTAARDLALQGAEAYERGDFDVALDRFSRANSLFAAPTIALMRARSLERLGRHIEALDAYEATQRTALAPDAPDAFRQATIDARSEAQSLRARVPRLTLHVFAGDRPPPGLTVTLDGRPLPPALLDVERPIDPGRHDVQANAEGYEPVVRTITLAEGERKVVGLDLVKFEPLAETPAPVETAPRSSTSTLAGWTFVGVGGALLVTSAATGLIALDKQSELDAACRPGCPESKRDDIDAFRTHRTLAYAALGLGAVSLGVGGYFLLSARGEQSETALAVGPGAVSLRGRF